MFKRIGAFLIAYPRLLFDPKIPAKAKYFPLIALAYLLLPLDIIPDFLPLLGQLDDIGVILVLLSMAAGIFEQTPAQKMKKKYGNVIDVEAVKKP